MKINKIKLENIRSYSDAEIALPNGTVLLSGNIGCGKSTILLALEFALFGLAKGELTGAGLLRNGEKHGSVEVNFDINGKNVTIKRTLKRGSAVSQEDGYITIDGKKVIGTAIELKEKILDLLNYPKDLMSKSNSMIYKYTVYTPQEEMKYILNGDEKYRIDALRRVFGIDKYKRITESCSKFISKLKEKKKQYAGMIADLEEKQKSQASKAKESDDIGKKLNEVTVKLKDCTAYVKLKEDELGKIEDEMKKSAESKKQLEVSQVELKYKLSTISDNKEKIAELEDEIKSLQKEIGGDVKFDKGELKKLADEAEKTEEELETYSKAISKAESGIDHSEELKSKISKLDICPVCNQKVNEEHARKVKKEEDDKIAALTMQIKNNSEKKKENEKLLDNFEKKIEELKELERKAEAITSCKEKTELKKKKLNELSKLNDELKKQVGALNSKIEESGKTLQDTTHIETKFNDVKKEFNEARQKERLLEIEKAGMENKVSEISKYCDALSKEINEKLKTRESLIHLTSLQSWLEEYFLNLMQIMEKKIMSKVHNDFDSLFQRLFEMIVDAGEMKVRLNEEFTPIIEQNGHEIDYAFLSGGEKTAVALAYRLALNQVINDIISAIHTKDLLILDEPTDGFSNEQLDRLRNVFDELKIGQIIVVSHEDKIESFVDNVIRLEKKDHLTKVL